MNEIDWSQAPEWAKVRLVHSRSALFAWAESYSENARFKRDDQLRENTNLAVCCWVVVAERPSTPSWSGKGLPPVGVVCEANFVGSWTEFEMRYYGESYVIFKTFYEVQRTRIDFDTCGVKFRPIRTPEQIAADEREAAIDAMLAATPAPGSDISLRVCEKLYDAGYRKP